MDTQCYRIESMMFINTIAEFNGGESSYADADGVVSASVAYPKIYLSSQHSLPVNVVLKLVYKSGRIL